VSNRVNLPGERGARAGGLAVAMRGAVRRHGGVWFGWSGNVADTVERTHTVASGKVTYVTVDLDRADYEQYYLGYANGTLWPLLHYRLGLIEYKRDAFEGYLRVNARMARLLRPLLRPDDLIWVHDYHLIPFAASLREAGVANRIGFFLHTPFPSADVLSALPGSDVLMRALCAYDLVGFQTADSMDAFLGCVRTIAGGQLFGGGAFAAFGRRSRAAVFPIGIDVKTFAADAVSAATSTEARRLRDSLAGRSLIIGVDRLDYSKGIPQRLAAIDALLTDHPQHRRGFSYLQITPHSRAEVTQYGNLRRELEATAGRVNGKFAEFDWSPIRYINKSFSQQTLAGFYRIARVGFVTPLRDGMNLVAKEFVAAQDPLDPGVLVLSRFAGAARELTAALLVNPIDIDEMAGALHRALDMPREERQERWGAMMAAIGSNTIETWRDAFLSALAPIADFKLLQRAVP
jgi:trehalose 6-phosphate synthase